MKDDVSRQYTLLAGSSNLALWGMLARFKTRFAADVAKHFCEGPATPEQKRAALQAAIRMLRCARKDFLETRLSYKAILSNGIFDLTRIPGVALSANVNHMAASHRRFGQINQYFKRVLRRWKDIDPDVVSTVELFKTISESIWPYYAVAYRIDEPVTDLNHSGYNLATWAQDSAMLREPFLSRIHMAPEDQSLALYPSLITADPSRPQNSNELLGNDPELISIVDKAGNAFLDFDKQENVVGLVQKITRAELASKFKIWNPVEATIANSVPKDETASYTDFFYFINQIARCILTKSDIDSVGDETPTGVLFLAGPSIEALCCIIDVESASAIDIQESEKKSALLKNQMLAAWKSIGGLSFTATLYAHMNRLKGLMQDLISTELRIQTLQSRIIQERAWAHDVKHWTDPILGDLHAAQRHIEQSSPAHQRVRRARLKAQILNAVTNARQASLATPALPRNTPMAGASHPFLSKIKLEDAPDLVNTVMQLLLVDHADTPRNPEQHFQLLWPNAMSLDEALQRLAEIISPGNKRADLDSVVGEAPVLWSMAFLREIVHNIRLNNRVKSIDPKFRQIKIEFVSELRDSVLHFQVIQRSYEMKPRPSNALAEGLLMANELYGATGIGEIDGNPVLKEEPIETVDELGRPIKAYHVEYGLLVRLNCPRVM